MATIVSTGIITIIDVYDGATGIPGLNGNTISPNNVYSFAGSTPIGFSLTNCAGASSDNGTSVTFTPSTNDSYITTPSFNLDPADNYIIALRVKLPLNAAIDGSLYYVNSNHGAIEGNKLTITGLVATGNWQDIIVDASIAAVDYMTGGNITSLRFDFTASTAVFSIVYIAIGKYGVSKSVDATNVLLSNANSTLSGPLSGFTGITFTGSNCDVTTSIGNTVLTPVAVPAMTSAHYPAALSVTTGTVAAAYTAGTGTLVSNKTFAVITAINGNSLTCASHPFTFSGITYYTTGTVITGLANYGSYVGFKVDTNTFSIATNVTTTVASFASGSTYYIAALGTTTQLEFNNLAGTSGLTYAVGSSLVCTTAGTGLTTTGSGYRKLTTLTDTTLPAGEHRFSEAGWNSSGYSTTSYTGGAKLTYSPSTLSYCMVGLSTNSALNASYTSIDYAFYITNTNLYIRELGVDRGLVGSSIVASDVLSIVYNNDTIRYYRNGICLRSITVASDLTLYMDSSFQYGTGFITNSITGLRFGAFTAIAPSKYTVDLMTSGVTVAVGTITGNIYAIPVPSAMTTTPAYVDVLVTVTDAFGTILPTITKRIIYSLARTGSTGVSARRVYVVTTSATPPATPTAGTGDVVPTTSGLTWSFTATSTLTAGQFMYQSDGLYTFGGNTTWGVPYLSNLKVGSLSALAVDTGSLTMSASTSTITVGASGANIVKVGNLGTSFGIQGLNTGGTQVYKLDSAGLECYPTLNTLHRFSGSYGMPILAEGVLTQTSTSVGAITNDIAVANAPNGAIRLFAQVVGFYKNPANATSEALSTTIAQTMYYNTTTGKNVLVGSTNYIGVDTSDSTNFPPNGGAVTARVLFGYNATTDIVYLRLVSRANQPANAATFYRYIIWGSDEGYYNSSWIGYDPTTYG